MTLHRFLLRCRLLPILACIALAPVSAAEPAIIARARAYVGPEAVLAQVNSLHYIGRLTLESPGLKEPATASVEIIFQKPARQRSVISAEKRIETTVLDGYEGWQRVQDPSDPKRWTLSLMQAEQLRGLRATVAENLSFFRPANSRQLTVTDEGPATVDGVACQKITFVYGPQLAFIRYFDLATGRLVLTETKQNESIREQGDLVVSGIRFPRALITTIRRDDGVEQKVTINFDKVIVNESFPDSLFAMPSLGAP